MDSWDTIEDIEEITPLINNVSSVSLASTKPAPRNWEALRPMFGWKSQDLIKKTFDCTTQLAKNVVRLPLHQHFNARDPSLNVRRIWEVMATDSFFASVVAIGGITCAQFYVGKRKKSIIADVGEGICMECGSKIQNKKCPNCDNSLE